MRITQQQKTDKWVKTGKGRGWLQKGEGALGGNRSNLVVVVSKAHRTVLKRVTPTVCKLYLSETDFLKAS